MLPTGAFDLTHVSVIALSTHQKNTAALFNGRNFLVLLPQLVPLKTFFETKLLIFFNVFGKLL